MKYRYDIAVVAKWPHQFSIAIPIINQLESHNISIVYYVSSSVSRVYQTELAQLGNVKSLDELESRYLFLASLHRRLLGFLANRSIFKLSKVRINKICSRLIGLLLTNPLDSRAVLNVTKSQVPWLMCAKRLSVLTFIGSWDHFAKLTAGGYRSTLIFAWNESIAKDWIDAQEPVEAYTFFPPQLLYIRNSREYQRKIRSKFTVMYAFASTRDSKHKGLFTEEMDLVRRLIVCAIDSNINMLIKPKPEGTYGELDELNLYGSVTVCDYSGGGAKDEMRLTDEYNTTRISELNGADVVLSCGTTFTIDAALFGVPVVVLDVIDDVKFPAITKFQNRESHAHIKKYLIEGLPFRIPLRQENDIQASIRSNFDRIESLVERGKKNAAILANWIGRPSLNGVISKKGIQRIIEICSIRK